jgi:Domain of unknown function (DUF4956)
MSVHRVAVASAGTPYGRLAEMWKLIRTVQNGDCRGMKEVETSVMGVSDLTTKLTPDLMVRIAELGKFLAVVLICAWSISWVYRRISPAREDEREFASTLFILTIAVGLLVLIIKQAPAISFGLFGAMSIIRFRTQIKKPRRMVFILMAAAIGVCCGAGEYMTTLFGTLMLSALSLQMYLPAASQAAPSETASADRAQQPVAVAPAQLLRSGSRSAQRWGIDIATGVYAGGRLRVLIVTDETEREILALLPDAALSPKRIARALERLAEAHGMPADIISDTWPEFNARRLLDWRDRGAITWAFADPEAREVQPFALAVSRRLADTCLSTTSQCSFDQVRVALDAWRQDFEHATDGHDSNPGGASVGSPGLNSAGPHSTALNSTGKPTHEPTLDHVVVPHSALRKRVQ